MLYGHQMYDLFRLEPIFNLQVVFLKIVLENVAHIYRHRVKEQTIEVQ